MSKTRDTGYLANVIQVHDTGVRIMSGSEMLMAISSSGAVTITGELSGSDAANSLLLNGTGSVGFTTTGSFSTASGSASSRLTQIEAVYATTGSNSFRATQSITGSLTVTGQIIAQTINVQQVTSSIVYSSGSNVFGCDINSRQTFTGSFYQTGSVAVFNSAIGIGTTTPCSILHVYGVNPSLIVQNSAAASVGNSTNIFFRNILSTGCIHYAGYIASIQQSTSANTGDLSFNTYNNGSVVEGLRIVSDGKVGINTSNPEVQLQVQKASCSAIRIRSCAAGGCAPVLNFFHDGNDEFTIRGGIGLTFLASGVSQRMYIGTNVDISTSTTISQKLAIGTSTTPDVPLGVGDWCNRGGRLLTSNCSSWFNDGFTPCSVITSTSVSTCRGNTIGLALHNDGQAQSSWAPTLAFSRRSWSGNYNSTMASITAQAIGCGNDSNWVAGDLVFGVTPSGGYMGEVMRISGNNTQVQNYLCALGKAYVYDQLCISNGSRIHSTPYNQGGYTGDGLWGATATPARIIGTGGESGFLLGYTDNGSGLYGAAYGFQVALKDGLNNCIDYNAIIMRNMGNGTTPFRVSSYGNIYGNSKNFRIKHPIPSMNDTHYLVHTSIEGPQADLLYRGKVQLVNGKAEVNIDEASRMTNGTFEALCQDVQSYTTNESGWTLIKSYIVGNILHIEAQDETANDMISWLVIGERNDEGIKNSAITDENGHVIVEELKLDE